MAELFDYEADDGTVYRGLSITEALKMKQDDEVKSTSKAKVQKVSNVMSQLEQMANSGNYSLEGAMALAAKNQVSDDPNVLAYIKSMADDMVNKNSAKEFGFDQQQTVQPIGNTLSGNQPQSPASSGNTLSSWSVGSPDFNEPTLSPDNEAIADKVKIDPNAAPWSSQNASSSATGNTVLSALQGGGQTVPLVPQQKPQDQQNDFVTRLPGEMQQYIGRTGLSAAEYETPVRQLLVNRDYAAFYKTIAGLVNEKRKADEALENNDRERAFGLTKDLYGKAPMSGPDGSSSFSPDDVARGKVSFGTERLESPISRSEHKSYSYSRGGGSSNSNEGLTKLMAQRTEFIKEIRESGLSSEEKTNEIRKYNSFIDQEAKKSGYNLPKVLDKSVVKWLGEASSWLDEQRKLPEKKRHAGYSAALRDYEAKKVEYGIID